MPSTAQQEKERGSLLFPCSSVCLAPYLLLLFRATRAKRREPLLLLLLLLFCSLQRSTRFRGAPGCRQQQEKERGSLLFPRVSRLSPNTSEEQGVSLRRRAEQDQEQRQWLPPLRWCCSQEQEQERGSLLFLCVSRLSPSVALQSNTTPEKRQQEKERGSLLFPCSSVCLGSCLLLLF